MRTLSTLLAVAIALLAVAAPQAIQHQSAHADAGLGQRYDTNDSGFIDRDEVLAAIFDYMGGELSKDDVLRLVGLYFSDAPITRSDETRTELEPGDPDSYVAVVPGALRAGFEERVSISLLRGDKPAAGNVRLALRDGEATLLSLVTRVEGTGGLKILVPQVESGTYEIELRVEGVKETRRAPVEVVDGVALFVETDKPIYKPGQTVHVRLMTLDALLKPRPYAATIEVQDAKGLKVFRKEAETDEFGMVTVDLPLSTEPNLGVWKLTAIAGDQKTELDVRVEEYVLPKYEVKVATEREWVLAGDPITGTVSGEYSFGKPVKGEVEIIASKYVGQWEEFARFSGTIDGETQFELRPAGFVAGVPQAGGQGNVTLDVTIREKGTGYEEKTSKLLTVVSSPLTLKVIPESRVFKPGLEMGYLIVAQTPDGTPVDTDVTLTIDYVNQNFRTLPPESRRVTTSGGKALVKIVPPGGRRRTDAVGRGRWLVHIAFAAVGSFAVRQLHPLRAADRWRHKGGRHRPVPGQLDQGSAQLLLRGALQGYDALYGRFVGSGDRAYGHPPDGTVIAPPRLPDPAEQRDRRRLLAVQRQGCLSAPGAGGVRAGGGPSRRPG